MDNILNKTTGIVSTKIAFTESIKSEQKIIGIFAITFTFLFHVHMLSQRGERFKF